jgi:hypothetical protein
MLDLLGAACARPTTAFKAYTAYAAHGTYTADGTNATNSTFCTGATGTFRASDADSRRLGELIRKALHSSMELSYCYVEVFLSYGLLRGLIWLGFIGHRVLLAN